MKQFIVLCLLCCCLGCNAVQKPVEVDVQVDSPPIAKLVKSVPSTSEIVFIGNTITLEFTEVPENLKISMPPEPARKYDMWGARHDDKHNPMIPRFSVQSFEYNGDTRPRFVIGSSREGESILRDLQKDETQPIRVIVQWTHGYKELDFDVKLAE